MPVNKDKLKEALDKSSEINRVLGITFMLFLLYVAVNIANTSDVMLFKGEASSFKLPILNLDLPLLGFYLVAPALIILFHYNLLFNLEAYARKLKKWKLIDTSDEGLHPFLFNYLPYSRKFVTREYYGGLYI